MERFCVVVFVHPAVAMIHVQHIIGPPYTHVGLATVSSAAFKWVYFMYGWGLVSVLYHHSIL